MRNCQNSGQVLPNANTQSRQFQAHMTKFSAVTHKMQAAIYNI